MPGGGSLCVLRGVGRMARSGLSRRPFCRVGRQRQSYDDGSRYGLPKVRSEYAADPDRGMALRELRMGVGDCPRAYSGTVRA